MNPVVARSKTALKILELRPKLLQDLQARTLMDNASIRDLVSRITATSGRL